VVSDYGVRWFLVGMGGVVGCIARYWLGGLVQRATDGTFPTGTLFVNLLGCFVLGFVMALSLDRGLIGGNLRVCLAVGLCGGFTTMSTFSYETLALLRDGEVWLAFGNVTLTVVAGLAAVWLGNLVAQVV
jgi:fluoride exporter